MKNKDIAKKGMELLIELNNLYFEKKLDKMKFQSLTGEISDIIMNLAKEDIK